MSALDSVVDALESRGCRPKRKSGGGYTSYCPAHEADGQRHHPSLGIAEGRDQPVVLTCGAGCSPETIVAALGLRWADLCKPNGSRPARRTQAKPQYVPPPDLEDQVLGWLSSLDATPDRLEWLRRERGLSVKAILDAQIGWDGERYTIPIRGPFGSLLRVKRYLPGGDPKYLEPAGSTPTLYGEQAIVGLEPGSLVCVCEGEIGATACRSAGLVAISATGGAGSWKDEKAALWAGKLERFDVVAIGDADPAGEKFGRAVVESVKKAGGFAVQLTWPSGTPEKTDPADYLAAHEPADLVALVEAARESGKLRSINLAALWDQEDPIPWCLPGMLADRDICIIGGEPGAGKSTVLVDLALALATGRQFMKCVDPVGPPKRVLYVDEENNPLLARHRLRLYLNGREIGKDGVSDVPLVYLVENSLKLDNDEMAALLHREIRSFRPDWLMIDSLVRFHSGDENSNSEMSLFFTKYLKPIRSGYNCGIVLLHHLAKPSKDRGEDLGHRLRGASDLRAMIDQLWGLEGDQATSKRILKHEKCRWGGRFEPLALEQVESDDGTAAWLEAATQERSAQDRLIQLLKDAGTDGVLRKDASAALVQQGYFAGARACSRTFGSLHGQGVVLKRKDGKETRYWLRTEAPPDAR